MCCMGRGKVFLRDSETKQWYAGLDRWATARADAREFATVEQASAFGSGLGVTSLEVVVHFAFDNQELVLPLRKRVT